MTDEEKISKEAKTCQCVELGRFFTQVASIFLGVLLAILVSAAILKPKVPCHNAVPFPDRPRMEKQFKGHTAHRARKHFQKNKGEFRKHKPNFEQKNAKR